MTRNLAAPTAEHIRAGTLLIASDTLVPASWRLDSEPVTRGWSRLLNECTERQFDADAASRGWTFFFRAGAVGTTSFGWDEGANLSKAVGQLASAASDQKCNCLQIDSVTRGSLLGIPRLRLVAHVRHIQLGSVFSGT